MSIWELPKEHYNWESPITKVYGDIHNEIIRQDEENYICAIEQAIGYRVDKDELIKALQYDREQYDKGYKDGSKETFIEELERIKAEIGKEFVDLQDGSEEWRSFVNESVLSCYEIVENRIHELKGENNAE